MLPCPISTPQTLGKTPNTSQFFSCQSSQTYSFRSIFSIHNHQPNYSQPFQVAGRPGLTRRCRFTTSGLITREAATSEHCVESRRHTGKESALYLATTNLALASPPSHPTLNQNNLWEALLSAIQGWGERREDCETSHTCHNTGLTSVCVTRCRMCRVKRSDEYSDVKRKYMYVLLCR